MDLKQRQLAFAAHLRDPEGVPAPAGIEPRRMEVYRQLFINNVTSLLSSTFPVTRAVLGEAAWARLAREFYAQHKAQTPYFAKLPAEFVEWLAARPVQGTREPPFLDELAHYEWVELALGISEVEPDLSGIDPQGDLLEGRPSLSPLAWPLAYRWPVHRLCEAYQPAEPPDEPTFIVVHRGPDGQVGFLQVDALTLRLLQLLAEDGRSNGRELLERIAGESPGADRATLLERGAQMLALLRERGAILGTVAAGA